MLHAGWQAAVVALIVFVILKLGRNRVSSQLRYALLLIVLLKFATPPFLSLTSGIFSQTVVSKLGIDESTTARFSFLTVESATPLSPLESVEVQTSSVNDAIQTKADLLSLPAEIPLAGQPQSQRVTQGNNGSHWLFWLTRLYLAGLATYALRIVLGYWKIRQSVQRAELQRSGSIYRAVGETTTKLNMRLAPELRLSDKVDAPFATGAFNPVIVLPRDLTQQLSADQLTIVIAHELVHIRRRDLLIGWIEVLLATIWWFHPAMWWLGRSLRQTREDCCDDVLLANELVKPERYCETIIQAAAYQTKSSFEPMALGFSNPEHPAGRRIKRMMDDSVFRSDRLRLPAMVLAILLALVVLPGMRQAPAAQATVTADANQTNVETSSKQKPALEPKVLARVAGKVEGSLGEPIAGATVKVSLISYPKTKDGTNEKLKTFDVESGEDGRFEVQCDQVVPPDCQLRVHVRAVTAAHIGDEKWRTWDGEVVENSFDIGALKLKRGLRVTGRVVAPTQNSQQPINPIVQVSKIESTTDKGDNSYFYINVACDKDGTFELMVPENCRLALSLVAENYAPAFEQRTVNRKSVSANEEIETLDLGDFKLRAGVSIVGTVKNRDGTPVAGAVVAIIQSGPDNLGANSELVSSTKTDREGKYRLPQHWGKSTVTVVKNARTRRIVNGHYQGLKADGEVPLFDLVDVNLEGKTGEHELNLVEAESVAISGKIRMEDGTFTTRCRDHLRLVNVERPN